MPDADQRPEPDEYFLLWVLIAQAKDAISRAREREYSRFGLNNERRAILYILENNGGHATPVDIARELFRELHSVTGMLSRMEAAGLVSRHKGTGRSKVEVRLTEHGSEVLEMSRGTEIDKKIFSVLTKRERERFASYLWKVRASVLKDLGIPEWQLNLSLTRGVEGGPGGEE
jgi:MarR family transcriptional regulator, organic hydroperoxide resistance regulator